jgi:predicted TPR repeat methyltransferase
MAEAEPTFQRALGLHRQGELDAAAALYREVLAQAPAHADALQLLGAIAGQQGRLDEAIELLRRAVALTPGNAFAHNNLGTALSLAHSDEAALASFERSLALMPDNVQALSNRGRLLRRLKRPLEALASLERALALAPDLTEALIEHGELLAGLSAFGMKRRDAAVQSFLKARELGADAESLHYALAAMGALPPGETPPAATPRSFVARLFDDYADNFDSHLTGALNYRTPALMGELLQRAASWRDADVLDLGCGTGLCGTALRPLARRLVGVDLSPKMLAQAERRGLYDELVCADIVEHLQPLSAAQDLIVAADVFVYIGDLAPVFAGAQRALRRGGQFLFSVEALAADEAPQVGYALRATRRYAHAGAYLQALAQAHGFGIDALEHCVLRQDAGAEVHGMVLLLRRL